MTPALITALAGIVAVGLGGVITYAFNVRARQRQHVEDLFNRAISAVAVLEVSKSFATSLGPEMYGPLDVDEVKEFDHARYREGIANHLRRLDEARESLAALHPYRPELRTYWETHDGARQFDEIMSLLADRGGVKGAAVGRRKRPRGQ